MDQRQVRKRLLDDHGIEVPDQKIEDALVWSIAPRIKRYDSVRINEKDYSSFRRATITPSRVGFIKASNSGSLKIR